ncbi:hypothetical protein ACFTXM_41465 [Streptomyces sp. NPDC056930]
MRSPSLFSTGWTAAVAERRDAPCPGSARQASSSGAEALLNAPIASTPT